MPWFPTRAVTLPSSRLLPSYFLFLPSFVAHESSAERSRLVHIFLSLTQAMPLQTSRRTAVPIPVNPYPPPHLHPGQLVLCQYDTYPVWPAHIHVCESPYYKGLYYAELPTTSGQPTMAYHCYFPDDDTTAWIRHDLVVPFHPTFLPLIRVSATDTAFHSAQTNALGLAEAHYSRILSSLPPDHPLRLTLPSQHDRLKTAHMLGQWLLHHIHARRRPRLAMCELDYSAMLRDGRRLPHCLRSNLAPARMWLRQLLPSVCAQGTEDSEGENSGVDPDTLGARTRARAYAPDSGGTRVRGEDVVNDTPGGARQRRRRRVSNGMNGESTEVMTGSPHLGTVGGGGGGGFVSGVGSGTVCVSGAGASASGALGVRTVPVRWGDSTNGSDIVSEEAMLNVMGRYAEGASAGVYFQDDAVSSNMDSRREGEEAMAAAAPSVATAGGASGYRRRYR